MYTGVVTLRRDSLVVVHLFITHQVYFSQDSTQKCAQAHGWWMLPLIVLAWETFQKTTLLHPRWHQRKRTSQTKVVVCNQKSTWDAIRSTPGTSPPHLGVEPGGMSKVPALIRDKLSPTREGKLGWKVCLHPYLEQGGTPLAERSHGCGCRFFLSYRWELAVPEPLL